MIIIKPFQDKPIYVEWSTIADGPGQVAYSREDALKFRDATEEGLARADANGTSCYYHNMGGIEPGSGAWDDDGLVADQRWLPREHIYDYALAFLAGNNEKMIDLTTETG